jgi:prepilin-type processing-associated H-X9-DG protein/prepilin-type N-terminal cleavage/methylation domain-containing protein
MKRRGFSLVEMMVVVAGIAMCIVVLLPFMLPKPNPSARNACQNNLKQLGIAFQQYVQDFNDHCPIIAVSNGSTVNDRQVSPGAWQYYGWADALFSYARSPLLYQCVSEESRPQSAPRDPTKFGYTDYWFNSNLDGLKVFNSRHSAEPQIRIIVFGDGNDGRDSTDARYALPSLPQEWIRDQNSPPHRHLESANYLFLDGHAKMLKPEQISTGPIAQSNYTFSPK